MVLSYLVEVVVSWPGIGHAMDTEDERQLESSLRSRIRARLLS